MSKEINTFAEYIADETRVSDGERKLINFQVALVGEIIEAKEERGVIPITKKE